MTIKSALENLPRRPCLYWIVLYNSVFVLSSIFLFSAGCNFLAIILIQCERFDDFWRKHPPMDHVHRAKIFAPFDALAGFDECINSKRVLYEEKRILSGSEKDEQNEKLTLLHSLTCNGKAARKNRPQATVTCFVPCSDEHNDWYSRGGQYIAITGTVKKVDCSAILIDDMMIALEDIAGIDMCDVNT